MTIVVQTDSTEYYYGLTKLTYLQPVFIQNNLITDKDKDKDKECFASYCDSFIKCNLA